MLDFTFKPSNDCPVSHKIKSGLSNIASKVFHNLASLQCYLSPSSLTLFAPITLNCFWFLCTLFLALLILSLAKILSLSAVFCSSFKTQFNHIYFSDLSSQGPGKLGPAVLRHVSRALRISITAFTT